jgi:hypothetical protein
MSIPNVSSLYTRIHKGAEGGLEFARIFNQLMISESSKEEFNFISYSDAAGDYKGVDGIMHKGIVKTGFQYKFIPSAFKNEHKSQIKSSIENAIKQFQEMDRWILVIPEDANKFDLTWLEKISDELQIQTEIWGHSRIINLMLKHKHIGEKYYPELNYNSIKVGNEPTLEDMNFFNKFLEIDADIAILMLKAQPTVADCKAIFSDKYYREVSDMYYLQYRNLFDDAADPYLIKSKKVIEINSSTFENIINKQHNLPGGMHMMQEKYKALNSNTKFYRVVFKDEGAEYGISFAVWCFLNGRWVFFPKPFRIVESIEAMRNDKDLNFMIKIFKWLGFRKILQKEYKNSYLLAVNHIVYRLTNKEDI